MKIIHQHDAATTTKLRMNQFFSSYKAFCLSTKKLNSDVTNHVNRHHHFCSTSQLPTSYLDLSSKIQRKSIEVFRSCHMTKCVNIREVLILMNIVACLRMLHMNYIYFYSTPACFTFKWERGCGDINASNTMRIKMQRWHGAVKPEGRQPSVHIEQYGSWLHKHPSWQELVCVASSCPQDGNIEQSDHS